MHVNILPYLFTNFQSLVQPNEVTEKLVEKIAEKDYLTRLNWRARLAAIKSSSRESRLAHGLTYHYFVCFSSYFLIVYIIYYI